MPPVITNERSRMNIHRPSHPEAQPAFVHDALRAAVLHPAPTLRKFFAKLISLLRDRYRPWHKTHNHSPDSGGVAGNPEWRSVTARTHPASKRANGLCRLVEIAVAQAELGRNADLRVSQRLL